MLAEQTKAPNFTLPDQDGKNRTLTDYLGQWVLLYFYPKDDTPGCTMEACSFRDNLPAFNKLKIQVLGISSDPVSSHKKFQDKYGLNFNLLSDPEKNVLKLYGASGFFTKRISYLIDPEGIIVKKYDKVDPKIHADEILSYFRIYDHKLSI